MRKNRVISHGRLSECTNIVQEQLKYSLNFVLPATKLSYYNISRYQLPGAPRNCIKINAKIEAVSKFFEKLVLTWESTCKCNTFRPRLVRLRNLFLDVHVHVDLHLDWPSTDIDLQFSPGLPVSFVYSALV